MASSEGLHVVVGDEITSTVVSGKFIVVDVLNCCNIKARATDGWVHCFNRSQIDKTGRHVE